MAREAWITEQNLIFCSEQMAIDSERFYGLVAKLEQKGFNKDQIVLFMGVLANDEFPYNICDYDDFDYLIKGDI